MNRKVFLKNIRQNYITEDSEDLDATMRTVDYTEPSIETVSQALMNLGNTQLPLEDIQESAKVLLNAAHFQFQFSEDQLFEILSAQLNRHDYLIDQQLINGDQNNDQTYSDDIASYCTNPKLMQVLQTNVHYLLWVINKHQVYTQAIYTRPEMIELVSKLYKKMWLDSKQLLARIVMNMAIDEPLKLNKYKIFFDSGVIEPLGSHIVCRYFTTTFVSQHEVRYYIRTLFDLIIMCYNAQLKIDNFADQFIQPVLDYLMVSCPLDTHFAYNCISFIKSSKLPLEDVAFVIKFLDSPNSLVVNAVIELLLVRVNDSNQLVLYTNQSFLQKVINLIETVNYNAVLVFFNVQRNRAVLHQQVFSVCQNMCKYKEGQVFDIVNEITNINMDRLNDETFEMFVVNLNHFLRTINIDFYLNNQNPQIETCIRSFLSTLTEVIVQIADKMGREEFLRQNEHTWQFIKAMSQKYNEVHDIMIIFE